MMGQSRRKPFALANWKMAMTISESLGFVHEFSAAVGDLGSLTLPIDKSRGF
jgi:hypothetical protein